MKKRIYYKPAIDSEELFEKTVLSCARWVPEYCWGVGWSSGQGP